MTAIIEDDETIKQKRAEYAKTIIQPKQKKVGLLQRKTERIKKELALIEKKANAFREKLKTEANIIYDE
jgi:hypothetical protein